MTAPATVRPDVWSAFRACRLWRSASDDAVARLATTATVRDVARGEVLASEGEAAERFFLVVAGRVRIYHLNASGRQITFETAETGDPVAAVAALAQSRFPANIETATSGTIASVPAKSLYTLLDEEPAIARTLITDLANRVVNFTSVVSTLTLDVPSRVAGYLFQRALQTGKPVRGGLDVDLGIKKGELATALGTTAESLSRAFAKLRDDGVLEVQGQRVTVFDVHALAELASGYTEGEGA
ncbi:MAG: Crp/Fnr family transcriptional regulator [Coriobacteriia bacterium]|nr:Crp/Fnr family transcriptional regulator [Coriobacteriia bacterium]